MAAGTKLARTWLERLGMLEPAQRARATAEALRWLATDRTLPYPPVLKWRVLRSYAFGIRVFVETGTFHGRTVDALHRKLTVVHTIELDEVLYRNAAERFAPNPRITVWHGNSRDVLPKILEGLNEPALFWLDAHFSGEGTACAGLHSPIMEELGQIFGHRVNDHIILIDDARKFVGANGYPTIRELHEMAVAEAPSNSFLVENDIIRIHPTLQNHRRVTRT